jgi:NAD(P)-dependent dehydrogenase (short-subunit alcohol dehydrogenase family)
VYGSLLRSSLVNSVPQVTTIQADAADEAAISGVCKQALNEEGKLDVFFANVGHVELLRVLRLILFYQAGIASKDPLESTTAKTFMNVMRVNALSYVLSHA